MLTYKKIKKNDIIKVIAGKDINKSGKVIEVDRDKGKVLVEGINLHKKTVRKSQKNQTGGIKDIESFINISNVMLICQKCKKPTKIGYIIDEKNKTKKRKCKKCNSEID